MGGLPRRRQDCMFQVLVLLGALSKNAVFCHFSPAPGKLENQKTEVGGCVNKPR